MNHSRTTLVLMEQIIMVLVFALAAALCVQVFVYASVQSRRNDERDRAAELAQSAAETLKHTGDAVAEAQLGGAAQLGGQVTDGVWQAFYDKTWQETTDNANYAYCLDVRGETAGVAGLARASIRVLKNAEELDDETLFALTAAWQEVDGDA